MAVRLTICAFILQDQGNGRYAETLPVTKDIRKNEKEARTCNILQMREM